MWKSETLLKESIAEINYEIRHTKYQIDSFLHKSGMPMHYISTKFKFKKVCLISMKVCFCFDVKVNVHCQPHEPP